MAMTKGTGTPPNSHFFARLRNLDAPESDNISALVIKKKKGDFSILKHSQRCYLLSQPFRNDICPLLVSQILVS